MPGMNERKVWMVWKKTKDTEDQKLPRGLMRYTCVLLVAVLERTLYQEHQYALNATLRRWPNLSHSGPPASTALTVPSAIHTQHCHHLCFPVHFRSVMQTTVAKDQMTDSKNSFTRFLYYTSKIWSSKDKHIYYSFRQLIWSSA